LVCFSSYIIKLSKCNSRQASLQPNGRVISGRIFRSEPQHMTYILLIYEENNICVCSCFSIPGIKLSSYSESPGMSNIPVTLKIEDNSNYYFKPGFPYNGRVSNRWLFAMFLFIHLIGFFFLVFLLFFFLLFSKVNAVFVRLHFLGQIQVALTVITS
jgi:hypothetical protein